MNEDNKTVGEKETDAPETQIENGKKNGAPALTKKQKVFKEIREWVVSLGVALIVVFIIKTFLFMPIRVDGSSMYPTLEDGERLGVTVYDVKLLNDIERGDVVICHYPGRTNKDNILKLFTVKTNFVKRVVGIPGDTVSRVSGVTYINGEAIDPSAKVNYSARVENGLYYYNNKQVTLSQTEARRYKFDYEYVLGEDQYFVVGDNRYNSHDSRTWNGPDFELYLTNNVSGDVGPITKDMIIGHARFVMWPLNAWRGVETDEEYLYPTDR